MGVVGGDVQRPFCSAAKERELRYMALFNKLEMLFRLIAARVGILVLLSSCSCNFTCANYLLVDGVSRGISQTCTAVIGDFHIFDLVPSAGPQLSRRNQIICHQILACGSNIV
jgi:hypothetical protein